MKRRHEPRRRAGWEHPNSLAASRDPEIQRKIREGRKILDKDQSAINNWAKSGCTSEGGQV